MYGARPLKRVIQKVLLNPMSVMILKGEINENNMVHVDLAESKQELTFKVSELPKAKVEEGEL